MLGLSLVARLLDLPGTSAGGLRGNRLPQPPRASTSISPQLRRERKNGGLWWLSCPSLGRGGLVTPSFLGGLSRERAHDGRRRLRTPTRTPRRPLRLPSPLLFGSDEWKASLVVVGRGVALATARTMASGTAQAAFPPVQWPPLLLASGRSSVARKERASIERRVVAVASPPSSNNSGAFIISTLPCECFRTQLLSISDLSVTFTKLFSKA
jgi:hypothetical protein